MPQILKINNIAEKARFGLVGVINTSIDFAIFLGLSLVGLPPVLANFISTSTAFSFSFYANKKYTFKNQSNNLKRQLVIFLVVTLFGLWVLQPIVILAVKSLMDGSNFGEGTILILAKLLATCVTLVWNYILYSKVVFVEQNIKLK